MIEATIYYDKSQNYPGVDLEEILLEFSDLNSVKVRAKQTERTDLRAEEQVIEEIRMIKPQSRGSVVASGGSPLPISRSKRLNLQNTPIILVRDKKKPVYVFPCKIGERYYSVVDGISFLKKNLPDLTDLEGEMEDALVTIISDAPEKLEEGLVLEDLEVDTPTGKTDLVFRDTRGQFLAVEVEREAADSAVGQILRLSAGFERHRNLSTNSVRAGIVCYRINSNVLAACERANIKVWKYDHKIGRFIVMS
ncbi:MAG TPA: endonuclease NucS domain-containing protein [Nitrososphaerales archaeon]|nr:endonuclease NucS domain-containing protein [Nitrososphaerales archaeon]